MIELTKEFTLDFDERNFILRQKFYDKLGEKETYYGDLNQVVTSLLNKGILSENVTSLAEIVEKVEDIKKEIQKNLKTIILDGFRQFAELNPAMLLKAQKRSEEELKQKEMPLKNEQETKSFLSMKTDQSVKRRGRPPGSKNRNGKR